jgi:hypothetical protein
LVQIKVDFLSSFLFAVAATSQIRRAALQLANLQPRDGDDTDLIRMQLHNEKGEEGVAKPQ